MNDAPMLADFFPPEPDEENRPMLLIRNAILAVKPAFEHVLGMTQVRVFLLILLDNLGEISQTEIHKHLGVDRAMITRVVKQMEADGLLERRTNPDDNRYTLVRLSPAGSQRLTEMIERIQEIENLLLNGMSEDEVTCLRRGLLRIRLNAEAITSGARDATPSI